MKLIKLKRNKNKLKGYTWKKVHNPEVSNFQLLIGIRGLNDPSTSKTQTEPFTICYLTKTTDKNICICRYWSGNEADVICARYCVYKYFSFPDFKLMILTHNPLDKQVTRPELLWGKGVRDEVLQIWTAGHFSLHIGVTVRNLQGERW